MSIEGEFQLTSTTNEIIENKSHYGSLALGLVAAAVAVDSGAVALDKYRSSKEAGVVDNGGHGNQSIIALPGCRNDGAILAGMYKNRLNELGDSYFLTYPARGFDMESIKHNLLEARSRSKDDRLAVLASSMGGMVISEALRDRSFRNEFGFIDRLVLDSSPSSANHIKKHTRFAMGAAAILRNSWAANSLKSTVMFNNYKKRLGHDGHVSNQQVYDHFYKVSHAPLHVINSQAEFMENTHFYDNDLAGTVGEIIYLSSSQDHVIDVDAASQEYEKIYDTDLSRIIDESRPASSHAAGPEYQDRMIEALDLSEDLEISKNVVQLKNIDFDFKLSAA